MDSNVFGVIFLEILKIYKNKFSSFFELETFQEIFYIFEIL